MYKIIGLLAVMIGTAGLANAGFFSDVKTAIVGHVEDANSRLFGEHEFIGGAALESGIFDETADGQDAAHWATGSVSIVVKDSKWYVQLNEDFNSGPLPDGHVYISNSQDINNEADFYATTQIDLGPLKLGKGASYYEIPPGMVVGSVTIWCKAFGEYIGSADVGRRMDQ